MDQQVIKAKNAMQKAARKTRMLPIQHVNKKYAMRRYKKQVFERQHKFEIRLDANYSKYIEWAILATIVLGVMAVSFPKLGILAGIMSLLIIAAIIDTKLKSFAPNPNEKEKSAERQMRHVHGHIKRPRLSYRRSGNSHPVFLEENGNTITLTEFPYRELKSH